MEKDEILAQIKSKAKQLKKYFEDDITLNESHGNYKFRIMPGDIQKAYIEGAEAVLSLLNLN